jgi:hypothetical protein
MIRDLPARDLRDGAFALASPSRGRMEIDGRRGILAAFAETTLGTEGS